MNDLAMLRGKDCVISDNTSANIIIRQPSLGEIEELDESAYMNMLAVFVSSPFDMIAQLDDAGIDFTKITSYQLFCLTYETLKLNQTKIIFRDLDFSKLKRVMVRGTNKIELRSENIVIDENKYNSIAQTLRKINCLAPPKFKSVANEYTKQKMIEFAHSELEFAKRTKHKSVLKTLISRAVNHPYFKYRLDEIWDMKIYAFYDSLKSISVIENSNYLSMGAYSGNIDISKINKNDFNWLREVKE